MTHILTRPAAHACLALCACLLLSSGTPPPSFKSFLTDYTARFDSLDVEHFTMDMRERLKGVASDAVLLEQEAFFTGERKVLKTCDRALLSGDDRLLFDLVADQIDFHLQRIALEQRWSKTGRPIPEKSLYELPDHERWYALFVRRFTATDITPEQVFALGEQETQRCLSRIDHIRRELGFADSASFQQHLQDPHFLITDKKLVIAGFARIDSAVRRHLSAFVDVDDMPVVQAREWADAGPNTPPGIYLPREDNGSEADVFQFNFYGGHYKSRAMTWLYMHEAIPGHHLQASLRRAHPTDDLRDRLFFPGNAEDWACYVEYYGDELGVYADPYQRLGKWEWDLVRSVRLVLDAGIHYYGWSHEQALDYWRKHIPGQEDIAEREVTRVTNWAAQALSYKVGADRIQHMRERMQQQLGAGFNAARFHRVFLDMGQVPFAVAERNIGDRLAR